MTDSAITASGLRKTYHDTTVLDGIDLDVPVGTVFALLGPNGAGKTTTVDILTTLLRADGGTARVAGHDVATDAEAVRRAIGIAGRFATVDNLLTGRENLKRTAKLRSAPDGTRAVTELLERFDLTDAASQPASTYSGGMRRRLDLAMALIHNPRVIFLDGPTAGLDPRGRGTVRSVFRDLVADGATLFLTTQDPAEADELANRIGLLDRGRVVAQGTPDELKRRVPGPHVRLRFGTAAERDVAARVLTDSMRDDDPLTLRVPGGTGTRSLRTLLDRLDEYALSADEYSVHAPGLDDVLLALTGRPAQVAAGPARR